MPLPRQELVAFHASWRGRGQYPPPETMFRMGANVMQGASTYIEHWTGPLGIAVRSENALAVLQDARLCNRRIVCTNTKKLVLNSDL